MHFTMDEDVTNAHNLSFEVAAAAGIYNDTAMTSSWNTNLTRLVEDFFTNITLHHIELTTNASLTETFAASTTTIPPTITTSTSTTTIVKSSSQLLANVTRHALNVAASAIMANGNDSSIDSTQIYDLPDRLEHAPQLTKSSLIKVYVLMVMAVLSLIGNVATMWNIYKTRMERRSSRHSWSAIYTLIFHLSIADLIVTGFCIIGDAAWYYTVQWIAGDLCCKLVKLFQMFGLYLSTYVLVLIGVDRWIAVKYPMKSLNMAKRCYRLLGGMYVLSLILSVPQYFIFRVKKGPFIEEFHQCVTHGFYQHDWQEQFYTTFTMIFMFFLPLVILFGSYLSTFRTISGSEQMFQGSKLAVYSNKPSMQTNRQRLIHKAKMKSLRISVVIIFAFLICWTPYNVMMILFIFSNPDKGFSEDLQKGIFFFGMANSLVNPLIYGAFHLCPMKRKASKYSSNPHSLTRGDSQRTPSMLTAVTQVDSNCRSSRTYRQASYYRTHSNGSNYKEHVGLLSTTPTALKKSASMRSPLPSHQHFVNSHQLHQQHHQHQLQLQQQQQQQQHQLQQPWSAKAGSSCALSGPNGTTITTMTKGTNLSTGSVSLNGLIGPKENISSV